MIVVDSDVLIDALRGRPDAARRLDLELQTGALATTSVSAFELRSGVRSGEAAGKVETLLAALTVLPFDEEAAEKAADVRRTLESEGEGIGMADYMIAGICLTRSGLLLTRNREHFGRVPGLSLGTLPGDGASG
ncbi:MAG TPA: type II toxin-antitoxin system VapC family toxin [Gemmatimonadota bacterium]|nr:type II toxin-antitoxin system VapC family toxin [Gemmatimonadota bacterium]